MDTDKTKTKGFWKFLFFGQRDRLIEQMAGEAARDCLVSLRRQVAYPARDMGPAEIRGYTRALAAELLDVAFEQAIERYPAAHQMRGQIIAAGVDELVGMVVRDVLCEQCAVDGRAAA